MNIRTLAPADWPWVSRLSCESEVETSKLEQVAFERMLAQSFLSLAYADIAYLIAFAEYADYAGAHFGWFRAWYPRFVYVDRVVVSAEARGHGVARALYQHVFDVARGAGRDSIMCEVNLVPPNPVSDAFHDRMGFEEIGRSIPYAGKAVRYLRHKLAP